MQFNSRQTQLSALKLAAFFVLVLGSEFVYLDTQLTNKLLISSIWLMIWLISAAIFTRLFKFDLWFWISSIKSLIVHQTLIFMQLSS
jgi:hypothetical protein